MCEYGWYAQPVAKGQPAGFEFDYATQGVCCAEAEVDTLTGECCVRRVDVVMDQGCPLNPLVDLGQVEGALLMSIGYFLTEEVRFGSDGAQLTLGNWDGTSLLSSTTFHLNSMSSSLPQCRTPALRRCWGAKRAGSQPWRSVQTALCRQQPRRHLPHGRQCNRIHPGEHSRAASIEARLVPSLPALAPSPAKCSPRPNMLY